MFKGSKIVDEFGRPTNGPEIIDLFMMVGLQGSGKSTYAKMTPSWYFSADDYRVRFSEEDNNQIFQRFYQDLDNLIMDIYFGIKENMPVILDNTNITIKDRAETFNHIKKWKKLYPNLTYVVTAVIMATPFDVCLQRVKDRAEKTGKIIPEEVVYSYRKKFCIPFSEEGFTRIIIINGITFNPVMQIKHNARDYAALMFKMINFNQENPHHKYTLGFHMVACQQLVSERIQNFYGQRWMPVAAIVHDWGKYYTKSYNNNGIAIYYSHAEVGTYELLTHLELIPQKDFEVHEVLRVLAYVNYHMRPFDWNTEKAIRKALNTFGDVLMHDLIEFNKIDKEACGTESEQINK